MTTPNDSANFQLLLALMDETKTEQLRRGDRKEDAAKKIGAYLYTEAKKARDRDSSTPRVSHNVVAQFLSATFGIQIKEATIRTAIKTAAVTASLHNFLFSFMDETMKA